MKEKEEEIINEANKEIEAIGLVSCSLGNDECYFCEKPPPK